MAKIAVVYWSGTGNTEAMANAVADGAKGAGAEAFMIQCSNFKASDVENFDAIAFGSPSMGAEVLEESEFQPMWDDIKSALSGKKIGLFGSYDWGDGEWMRNWNDEVREIGANLVADGTIANNTPSDDDIENCKSLGASLV